MGPKKDKRVKKVRKNRSKLDRTQSGTSLSGISLSGSNLSGTSLSDTGSGIDSSIRSINKGTKTKSKLSSESLDIVPLESVGVESYGQNLYDSFTFIAYCSTHKKIALMRDRKKGLFLPFAPLKPQEQWSMQIIQGVCFILSHGDVSMFSQMSFTAPELIHILRLQLPQRHKFITRLTYSLQITKGSGKWSCCQNGKRVSWYTATDVQESKIRKLWGPEPILFANQAIRTPDANFAIEEISMDHAMKFAPREPLTIKEQDVLKSAGYTEETVIKLYNDFIQALYPSQYMTYYSFSKFMIKLGWSASDRTLPQLFKSFRYKNHNFLSFHELILGLAAMDPATPSAGSGGEARCGYIFRYYDANTDGYLDYQDVINMTQDIFKTKDLDMDEAAIEKEAKQKMQALKLTEKDLISFQLFRDSVFKLIFRGTSSLVRAEFSTTEAINFTRDYDQIKDYIGVPAVAEKAKKGGFCPVCRPKKYRIALNCVNLDLLGRSLSAKSLLAINPTTITFNTEDKLTEKLKQYSRDTIFNSASIPNMVLDIFRQYDALYLKKCNKPNNKVQDWNNIDKNTRIKQVTEICKVAQEIFQNESRCMKVQSPVFVFGDIHGNLSDLMCYERLLWPMGPTVSPASYLFLGDYVDRGEFGVECTMYLLALKILAPEKYFLCRGNHEIRAIQRSFTFRTECLQKFGTQYGEQIWNKINDVFDRLPICALIDDGIFCAHGGIPTSAMRIEDLMKIRLPLSEPELESPAAWEMMWNDPINNDDYNNLVEALKLQGGNTHGYISNNKRGTAYFFNEEAVDTFLNANGLTHILRGHEVVPLGYRFNMKGKVITIFSSAAYCGGSNEAACLYFDSNRIRVLRLQTTGNI